jgi:hypothetical protein
MNLKDKENLNKMFTKLSNIENYMDELYLENGILKQQVLKLNLDLVTQLRGQFDNFYAWLDGLTQEEYDDMSLTDKCEKFFFKN